MIDDEDEAKRPGRSLKIKLGKREAASAEKLTDELVDAKPQIFNRVELDPILREALVTLRGMFGKKERPRHLRFVQRLVRESDQEALAASLALAIETGGMDPITRRAERWRDRISADGDAALEAFVDDHPDVDRTELRQAMLRVQKSKNDAETTRNRRSLLVLLRDAIREAKTDESSE